MARKVKRSIPSVDLGNIGNSNTNSKNVYTTALHDEIRENIKILEELQFHIRELRDEEKSALRNSIENEGVKEPIILWKRETEEGVEYILVDGHHRYQAVKAIEADKGFLPQHISLKLDIREDFNSLSEVKIFMSKLQMGRRNMTSRDLAFHRGFLYNEMLNQQKRSDENIATILSEEFACNERTIRRNKKLYEGLMFFEAEERASYLKDQIFDWKTADIEKLSSLSEEDRLLMLDYMRSLKKVSEQEKESTIAKGQPTSEIAEKSSLDQWKKFATSNRKKIDKLTKTNDVESLQLIHQSYKEILESIEQRLSDLS